MPLISEKAPEEGLYCKPKYTAILLKNNVVLYSGVVFNFGHICRWDQCAVYILYSKLSTDPGLLKIRHSHRFVAVVIQILIPYICDCLEPIGVLNMQIFASRFLNHKVPTGGNSSVIGPNRVFSRDVIKFLNSKLKGNQCFCPH